MKKTSALKVSPSLHIPRGKLLLHPNEGFDLGLMRVAHPVVLCRGVSATEYLKGDSGACEDVELELLNQCPALTLQLNAKHWQELGSPARVVVLFDGERLFLQPLTP